LSLAQDEGGCPLCAAGGYAASSSGTHYKWLLNNVWAPGTETEGETFLWYRVNPKIQVGAALLWKQKAVRVLANAILISETEKSPNLRIGFGTQEAVQGNPGVFATAEKNWKSPSGTFNAYVGVGHRFNEDHSHPIGGAKYLFGNNWALGIQHDGHRASPFATYTVGPTTVGAYLINMKSLGVLAGVRF